MEGSKDLKPVSLESLTTMITAGAALMPLLTGIDTFGRCYWVFGSRYWIFFLVFSPSDVLPRVWGFASTCFVDATDALVNKSQIKTHSADRIMEAQEAVNVAFWKAKQRGVKSHYGIFKRVEF